MAKKYNLSAIVVFITLIEGIAIYVNMLAHPDLQPSLTIVVVLLAALISGIVVWYLSKKNTL